jgi:hypothetical protein
VNISLYFIYNILLLCLTAILTICLSRKFKHNRMPCIKTTNTPFSYVNSFGLNSCPSSDLLNVYYFTTKPCRSHGLLTFWFLSKQTSLETQDLHFIPYWFRALRPPPPPPPWAYNPSVEASQLALQCVYGEQWLNLWDLRDFSLRPQCKWDLTSSGMFHCMTSQRME